MLKSITYLTVASIALTCSSMFTQSAHGGWWRSCYNFARNCYCTCAEQPAPAAQAASKQATGPQTRTAYYPPTDEAAQATDNTVAQPVQATYDSSAYAPQWSEASPRTQFLAPVGDNSPGRLPWTPSASGWSGRGR